METLKENLIERSPIIVVMGHVDHGKSKLLDFIRKTNVVDQEAGGITQHISAYEVAHEREGKEKHITFLDTPGHEAFSAMRSRGAKVADIAILVVSAEEGVKAQTLEAYKAIKESGIPLVVAINKIDKPQSDIQNTISSLIEHEIYIEGYGGDIPHVPISAKEGTGVSDLLDIILLVAELEELKGNPNVSAEGIVVETNIDTKKGISATLIIRNGTLKSGMVISAGNAIAPVRIMENFLGKNIKEATFSMPIRITGFDEAPPVGSKFFSFKTKKEAIENAQSYEKGESKEHVLSDKELGEMFVISLVLKGDTFGSIEAVRDQIHQIKKENTILKIVQSGVGAITEGDIKSLGKTKGGIALGFNVDVDRPARELGERMEIEIHTFDIVYKLLEWLNEKIEKERPQIEEEEVRAKAKVMKFFSKTKDKHVIGGKVKEGTLAVGQSVKIIRREEEIGKGTVVGLQQQKAETKTVSEDGEFGALVKSSIDIAPGDELVSFEKILR